MHPRLLEILRCPTTGSRLRLENADYVGDRVRSGVLAAEDTNERYPVRAFIPRFVPQSNYADSFGMQWNKFRRTQLDSYSGQPISAERFWKATGWRAADLAGQRVLDAGCGAGRFAEIALGAGATVVALDYSSAVDACYANLRDHPNLHVVQGDIYALPFAKRSFPLVYSLGVLQHTPDVAKAFHALPPMVAHGGRLCVDFYEKSWRSVLQPKYLLRPLSKHIEKERLFSMLESAVPKLLPLSCAFARVPFVGGGLKRLVPVANYVGTLPLTPQQHLEWSLLDTFDWLAPEFDDPPTESTVRTWLTEADLVDRQVLKAGHLVARGKIADAPGD
jgi:2-polyprenyl-3-methyl-5-hydroxy-6-metoxy-1,4-benzoquinol methylase